jgi:hypothetical protein
MFWQTENLPILLLLTLCISCCQSLSFYVVYPSYNSNLLQVQKPSTCRQFHPSSKKYRSSYKSKSTLYSTIFDADQEIDWDAEDDDDDDDFDIQSNSIHDNTLLDVTNDMDKSNGNTNGNTNGKSKDMTMMDLNDLDDTDESYYEKLFLLQNLSDVDKDDDEEEEEEEENQTQKQTQPRKQNKNQTNGIEYEQMSNVNTHNYEYKQRMAQRKEWKEKVHQMRNESIQTRKFQRKSYKRGQLEERASFLALRALRLQSTSVHEHEHEHEHEDEDEDEDENDVQQERKQKQKQPVPSLSISSMRNYKRKGDELNKIVKQEQKLYGKRFKNAQSVYIRLFEVLEDMRIESVKIASEMIADRVEEEAIVSVGGSDRYSSISSRSSRRMASRFADDVTKMNEIGQSRMNTVTNLSLNGREKDVVELSVLDNVDTDDLLTILRIRGNVRRRGRTPKTRSKVLEYVEESFAQPLF